jgi:hypothetical protein
MIAAFTVQHPQTPGQVAAAGAACSLHKCGVVPLYQLKKLAC